MKYAINAQGVPDAIGPYSQGTTAGRLVFASGQLPVSPDDPRALVPGGASAQTALPAPPDDALPLREQLRHCRAAIVRDTLRRCGGNRREAARRLGVSYASLRRFLLGQDDA